MYLCIIAGPALGAFSEYRQTGERMPDDTVLFLVIEATRNNTLCHLAFVLLSAYYMEKSNHA